MTIRDRLQDCAHYTTSDYVPFVVDGHTLGRVRRAFAATLREFSDVFKVSDDTVTLVTSLDTFEERTRSVGVVLETLKQRGLINGWRGEPYPVSTGFYDPPLLTIERAAAVLFGTMAYGVNLNGYVRDGGDIRMWIARRSHQKPVAPGKLDHTVAGGQPVGISVKDNLVKECWEEAGIPTDLAQQAQPVGTMSYLTERSEGLRHSLFFNFDLELPHDFQPQSTDGEVDAFYLWSMDQVFEKIRNTDDFKFDVPIGLLDFAIRHGVFGPDDPDYIEVNEAIRLGRGSGIPAR